MSSILFFLFLLLVNLLITNSSANSHYGNDNFTSPPNNSISGGGIDGSTVDDEITKKSKNLLDKIATSDKNNNKISHDNSKENIRQDYKNTEEKQEVDSNDEYFQKQQKNNKVINKITNLLNLRESSGDKKMVINQDHRYQFINSNGDITDDNNSSSNFDKKLSDKIDEQQKKTTKFHIPNRLSGADNKELRSPQLNLASVSTATITPPPDPDHRLISNVSAEKVKEPIKEKFNLNLLRREKRSSAVEVPMRLDRFRLGRPSTPRPHPPQEIDEQLKANDQEKPDCILGNSDMYLSWWVNPDGSLRKYSPIRQVMTLFVDLSAMSFSEMRIYEELLQLIVNRSPIFPIIFLSLARNDLTEVPHSTLTLVNSTIEYLSLTGNTFYSFNGMGYGDNDQDWATFPVLENLKELDIRNCSIHYLGKKAFAGMPQLEKLFMSENQLLKIVPDTFQLLTKLVHLDLSRMTFDTSSSNGPPDIYLMMSEGLNLSERVFDKMSSLKFVDLSYTKLSLGSFKAMNSLGSSLEQLSLCYTTIPALPCQMFKRTNLRALDISGNPMLTTNFPGSVFKGLEDKLEILSFENSNVKNLNWFYYLQKLKILRLRNNNVNQLTNDSFVHLPNIEILDLSSNHVGNWYFRVFEDNKKLRILNLHDNTINVLTEDMMEDFANLEFLGIGNNNFICTCLLREFIDIAAQNNRQINCTVFLNPVRDIHDVLMDEVIRQYEGSIGMRTRRSVSVDEEDNNTTTVVAIGDKPETRLDIYDISSRIYYDYVKIINGGVKKMKIAKKKYGIEYLPKTGYDLLKADSFTNGFRALKISQDSNCSDLEKELKRCVSRFEPINSNLSFTFQLLDFEEENYKCFDSPSNTEFFFSEFESCIHDRTGGWPTLPNNLEQANHSMTIILVIAVVGLLLFVLCYYKWWYIRYFFILIKNATILSFLDKEKTALKKHKDQADAYTYDVFVSYCDENREWVLEELLPNIESRREISVCLHERDFQVGLSILENIIACMDRSRCLLLIISQSFLLSQWCQFEMHLAQHRLLETRRDHLVLVLLEDVPKRKRSKTLHYLMRTKTYIKWPSKKIAKSNSKKNESEADKMKALQEEQKMFWKRLRRALIETDWESDHSVV